MEEKLDFWSRRRAAVAAEAKAEAAAVAAAEEAEAAAAREAAQAEKTDAEILEELGLPDPESLVPGQDVAGFMQAAVPDRIRRQALRQLWKLNPALANLDMLVDYGEDFTDAATVLAEMPTAYRVGKGMLAHLEEMAKQEEAEAAARAEAAAEAGEDAAPGPETAEAGAEAETAADAPKPSAPDIRIPDRSPRAARPLPAQPVPARLAPEAPAATAEAAGAPAPDPEFAPPPRRRMRFAFDEA